jgi:hypothetical protein
MKQLRRLNRAGQSLVEFAVVSLVLYMLLAAILTFGHMLYVAQGLQSAADLAAREISRTPLPTVKSGGASFEFDDALSAVDVRQRIYDEAFLVIDLDNFYDNFPPPPDRKTSIFQDLAPTLPLLNQQLLPLMIVETPANGATGRLLRYPGALIARTQNIAPPDGSIYSSWVKTDLSVAIPLVVGRSTTGTETIQWVDVVEEIKADGAASPFSIDSPQRGVVALRMNYPFQSATMSSFQHDPGAPDYPFESTVGRVNVATNAVVGGDPPQGTVLDRPLSVVTSLGEEIYTGTYGGKYGLGAQGAFGKIVRPYRRVISAQAIYRREVFE